MPLFFDKEIDTGGRICIWEITESLAQLEQLYLILNSKSKRDAEITSAKRRLEWITIRILLSRMLTPLEKIELHYNEDGKPFLSDSTKHISVSHTKQFVAVAIHENKTIGIDVELLTSRIEKIKDRFLNDQESEWTTGVRSLEKLYIVWGAKECAFKIYSKGGLDFKKMLRVNSFVYSEKGTTILTLKKNNVTCAYPVWWENLGEIMLVYSIEN